MNTEITDKETQLARGWIFYDGGCGFCVRGVGRWGELFARRGFIWLPLQTAGTAARLRVSEADLLAEMHLLLPDNRIRRGVDAWAAMLRAVWWLWPVGVLLAVPGLRQIGAAIYRLIARNRYGFAGKCLLPNPPRHRKSRHHHGATTFWEMP